MYHWQDEILAEQHRREILNEVAHIQLEKEAERAGIIYHSNCLTRGLEGLGARLSKLRNWSAGIRLHHAAAVMPINKVIYHKSS